MKFPKKLNIFILLLIAIPRFATCVMLDSTAKKTVFIIVDGISADQLKAAYTPILDSIARVGSYTDAFVGGKKGTYSQTPTISAVGYNSLLTGTWVNKHNVWGNGIKNPNYHYQTIFKFFKDYNPSGTTAVFSSWLDNRTKLVGDKLPQTGGLNIDFIFDGLEHDNINFPHDKERNFMKLIDYSVADKAAQVITEEGPDLSWIYLEFPDDMGHAFGDSPRFNAAIQFEDQLIGKIWKAVLQREKQFNEDWLLVITTDHGRKASDGRGHGGQTERERSTWVVLNEPNTNNYFQTQTPGIVDIMPTIADFMGINIPLAAKRELDGISLLKKVDVIDLTGVLQGNSLQLSWKNISTTSTKAKVLISDKNDFEEGGSDTYTEVAEVMLSDESIKIPMKQPIGKFYKVILEAPNNTINTWILN